MKAYKYDLSAERYRQIEQDDVYYDNAAVILERLEQTEDHLVRSISEIRDLMK